SAQDRTFIRPIGETNARSEQDGLRMCSGVARDVSASANEYFVGVRIIPLDSELAAVHDRKVLESHTDVDAQLATHLPVIAYVIALLGFAGAHRVVELIGVTHLPRQAKQERGVGVEVGRRRTTVQRSNSIDEAKTAARAPTANLRLPVVHLM